MSDENYIDQSNLESSMPPKSVGIALWLLWFSLVISFVATLVTGIRDIIDRTGSIFMYAVSIAIILILIFLTLKISAGRNWARTAFAVIFMLGTVLMLCMWPSQFPQSHLAVIFGTIRTGIPLYALFLLFSKSGDEWFRK